MGSPNRKNKSQTEKALWEAMQAEATAKGRGRPTHAMLFFTGGVVEIYQEDEERDWDELADTPGQFPAAVGWSCRGSKIGWNGQGHEYRKIPRTFLRALIHHRGEVVPDKTLKLWVWGDARISDGRLKDVAFQARTFVRLVTGLTLDVDPVERTEGGYRLAVGW